VAIVLGGFLIYCALAGVGGALAGKAEDLGSTNVLFSLTLVASFLICLLGGSGDETISSAAWLDFVPFTAILVTPARVLLGNVPLWQGAVTLAIVMLTAAALCVLAGKVYRMMSLYKGDPPTPRKMVTMLINHK
jgi:ABC-type Na+ efflux pump permease subunit